MYFYALVTYRVSSVDNPEYKAIRRGVEGVLGSWGSVVLTLPPEGGGGYVRELVRATDEQLLIDTLARCYGIVEVRGVSTEDAEEIIASQKQKAEEEVPTGDASEMGAGAAQTGALPGTTFVNLLSVDVVLRLEDGEEVIFPASGRQVNYEVASESGTFSDLETGKPIPVSFCSTVISDLPEPELGVAYIVEDAVARAVRSRTDLLAPDRGVVEEGKLVVKGFVCYT